MRLLCQIHCIMYQFSLGECSMNRDPLAARESITSLVSSSQSNTYLYLVYKPQSPTLISSLLSNAHSLPCIQPTITNIAVTEWLASPLQVTVAKQFWVRCCENICMCVCIHSRLRVGLDCQKWSRNGLCSKLSAMRSSVGESVASQN